MKLSAGDYVLVQEAIYGYSPIGADLGPFICQIVEFVTSDTVKLNRYLNKEKTSYATGTFSIHSIIAKIHEKDRIWFVS